MTRSTVAEAKNMQGEEIVVSHMDEPAAVKVDILPGSDRREDAFGRDSSELPPGYFWSTRFIGSYCAIGVAFACGTGGFALVAPILDQINNSFGEPSKDITWVGIVYTLAQAIVFMLAGRLSDIFGRRWFFIVGSVIGLAGSIVGATAHSIGQLIAGETLIGIAAGFQISFFWVVSEIVPMKRRFLANAGIFLWSLPTNTLGPKIAINMQNNTAVHWRGCFYYLIALNAVSVLLWYCFYFPPTFQMLHKSKTAKELLKDFDYVGLILFSTGMLLLLMGLNWGGNLYPWKSGHVIGTIVSGIVALTIFGLYESFVPLKEPYLPVALLQNYKFAAASVWASIAAMTFYAFGLIWPQAVVKLYPGISPDESSTLAGLVTMAFVLGQMTGPFIANWAPPKPFLIVTCYIGTALLTALAADPLNKNLTIALLSSGNFILGAGDGVCMPMTTFPIRSQEEIGTAGGLSGSIRLTGSSIAVAMYSTILTNRLSVTVPQTVGPAALSAGLAQSALPDLIKTLNAGSLPNSTFASNLSSSSALAIEKAYRLANSKAYQTTFLSTLGFGGLGLIIVWFTGGIDESKGDYVAGQIHRPDEEKV
ncbi:hypothetical protein LTS17_012818 [Exophiala oligosperma]